jgi:hypothetical protein
MMSQGAGGGYGDVLERDPERVIKDIEEGLVSHEIARTLFCVRFDETTLAIDHAATQQARADERKARIVRGVPFHEFVENWVRPEPPASIPYFGSWGDDISVIYANGVASPADAVPRVMMPDPRDVKVARLEAEVGALRAQLATQG